MIQIAAGFPGLDQFLDIGNGITALQQLVDHLQAGKVDVVIDAGAATPLGWRQQAAILVGTDIADGTAGYARQLVDGIFLILT